MNFDNPVTDYWAENYVEKAMCSLCAQSGVIDTTGMRTPAGLLVGRVNFCICPNGQSMRLYGGVMGIATKIVKDGP